MKFRLFFLLFIALTLSRVTGAAPTDGYVQVSLNYYIQYPFDLQMSDRYSLVGGTNHFWVFTNDQPFEVGSPTEPRTEMRVFNDYTNGIWEFEGDLLVPSGTTGVAVMQVFGGVTSATSLQLRVYNGGLYRYTTLIMPNIYDRWVHINVVHNADIHNVVIYTNSVVCRVDPDRGATNYYFKCGVYIQDSPSSEVQSYWKNLKVWRRPPQIRNLGIRNNSLVILGTNGPLGGPCYVLTSTNLGALPSDWTPIATNYFDSHGSFNYTNIIDPTAPKRFFLLGAP